MSRREGLGDEGGRERRGGEEGREEGGRKGGEREGETEREGGNREGGSKRVGTGNKGREGGSTGAFANRTPPPPYPIPRGLLSSPPAAFVHGGGSFQHACCLIPPRPPPFPGPRRPLTSLVLGSRPAGGPAPPERVIMRSQSDLTGAKFRTETAGDRSARSASTTFRLPAPSRREPARPQNEPAPDPIPRASGWAGWADSGPGGQKPGSVTGRSAAE